MNKRILVIVGPSGVGKTTVAGKILELRPEFSYVRSATTRPPRGDGNDGEYLYVDREEFSRRIKNSEMLEYMEYGDNFYGTPRSEIDRIFSEGKIPLLILDINGAKSLRKSVFPFESYIVYLFEDINVIERRLYNRELSNDPSAEALISFTKRKNANIRDYRQMPEIAMLFNAFVRCDSIDGAANGIYDAFAANLSPDNSEIVQTLFDSANSK